jgi:imidazoleglycerol-phosphate dehydratase
MTRAAVLNRDTNETKVQVLQPRCTAYRSQVSISLDGGALPNSEMQGSKVANGTEASHAMQATASQTIDVNTGIGFLDHVIVS